MHCDLDLGGMTLGQGHDTTMGHGQQLCEVLFRSNLAVRRYGPSTDFGYVCTVTLTLEIGLWVKVVTHPRVMDNNCVKYYPDRTSVYQVMARTRCEQTDKRTDRVIPIYPQTLFEGGIIRPLRHIIRKIIFFYKVSPGAPGGPNWTKIAHAQLALTKKNYTKIYVTYT